MGRADHRSSDGARGIAGAFSTVAALAALAFPSEALADDDSSSLGAGLRLYLALEEGTGPGFGWAVHGFRTHVFDDLATACNSKPRTAVGPVIGVGAVGLHAPRVFAGAYAGKELERSGFALGGELGLTYRFGERRGFGVHTALLPSVTIFQMVAQHEWLLNESGFGAGAWYALPFGEAGMCAEGRALRGASGARVRARARVGRRGASLARCREPELALAAFARDAQAECESVSAFLQLGLELSSLGAPEALVHAALSAARDEIGHARALSRLAGDYAAAEVTPVLPRQSLRAPVVGPAGLARLAVESFVDGCIGEAQAAARASAGAGRARDARVARVRARIAEEEAAHAALGWQLVDLALATGGEHVADALAAARTQVRATLGVDDEGARSHDALAELGWLSAPHRAQLAERVTREALGRLERRLSRRARA